MAGRGVYAWYGMTANVGLGLYRVSVLSFFVPPVPFFSLSLSTCSFFFSLPLLPVSL